MKTREKTDSAASLQEDGGATRLQKPGLSRRSLIGGAAMAAGLLAFGGATAAFGGETDRLRPPGGQDDDRFWGACIRCDRCRAACPLAAIGVEGLTPGIIGARLPIMDFREGYCDMCERLPQLRRQQQARHQCGGVAWLSRQPPKTAPRFPRSRRRAAARR